MKITLTKAGKNIRISFDPTETTQPDMLEDSANVEVTYQNLNNNVTVSISGGANFQTGNITTGTFLYMDSGSGPVLINSKALFITNYSLVFPSGGGGPVTTPNIDQVLAEGGSLTAFRTIDFDGQSLFFIDSNVDAGLGFAFNGPYQSSIFSNNSTFSGNQVGFYFDDNIISVKSGINENGLKLDFANRGFYFGDFAGIYNSTAILIEDTANEIVLQNSQTTGFTEIKANQLKFTGANLESGSSSGNSGQHLVIELNGVTYHIALENP